MKDLGCDNPAMWSPKKVKIKGLKNCRHLVEVELPPEMVKEEFERVYKDIGKSASVPGFRQGRVPRDLLELHFGKSAKEEVIKRLVSETYEKILEEHKLEPIGYPDISDIRIDNGGLFYKATVEIRPEVQLKNYKGLRLKKKVVEIKEEDVLKNLEYIREAHAQEASVGDAERKEKTLPKLDDEFAKDIGFENLEKLKDAIRQNLKRRLDEEVMSELEMQIINQLLEMVDFEIPESLINSEKERLLEDTERRLRYIQGLQENVSTDKKFELDEKDRKELEERAYIQAQRRVKAFFILDAIAEAEKIYIQRDEFEGYIEDMAMRYKKTKEEMYKYLEEHHLLNEIAVDMRNKKVMEFLLKEAKIEMGGG